MAELTFNIRGLGRKQLIFGALGLTLSVAIAWLSLNYIREHTSLVGLPRDSYKDLSFQVFFPKHPPKEFSFDPDSISSNAQVLTYGYKYQGSKPVAISIQPLDPAIDTQGFKPTREFNSSIGRGYLANFDTRTSIAILAGKSLVLINSPHAIPDTALETLANSLAPMP